MGDDYHTIRLYYIEVGGDEAKGLAVGDVEDPDENEVAVLWANFKTTPRDEFRPHIAQALNLYEALKS